MCLVLKSDNGKVVSIANEQNHRQTESCQHPVPYYYMDESNNVIRGNNDSNNLIKGNNPVYIKQAGILLKLLSEIFSKIIDMFK